jgi:hypothetical protein
LKYRYLKPSLRLNFIQKLDLREFEEGIHADEYEKRKNKILDGA